MASADVRKELDCSICLSIYTDPVTLRCGHNFCRVCIDRVLDTQEGSGVYTCPECRAESEERPALIRNIPLCNIVRSFPTTQPDQEETGNLCTYCIHGPVPAVKSCLHCEAFLCDSHLRVHSKSPEHVLCDPTTSLGNKKCSIHKKILEYYCTEDSVLICVYCAAGEHRGHNVEKLDEASEKRKEKLRNVLQKITTKREETENKIQRLQEHRREDQETAAGVKESITILFRDIRRQLEDLEKRVLNEISRQEEHALRSVSDLIQQMEMKKGELFRKIQDIEELCNMSDPVIVLQEPKTGDFCDTDDTEKEDTLVHKLRYQEIGLISETLHKLSDIIRGVNVCFYMQGPTDITLDINTASNDIHLSDDMKIASWSPNHNRPETPVKFTFPQVLSSGRFSSGKHYWELDVSKSGRVMVGMCYTNMHRRGDESYMGDNSKSWGLWRWRYKHQCSVRHDSNEIQLPGDILCDQVRIYLDYEAGQLSFYALGDPIRHLHTFSTTFTDPLHVVLCVWEGCIEV